MTRDEDVYRCSALKSITSRRREIKRSFGPLRGMIRYDPHNQVHGYTFIGRYIVKKGEKFRR